MGKKNLTNVRCLLELIEMAPANLFSRSSLWRNYLVKVKGAHAWQLRLSVCDEPVEDVAIPEKPVEMAENP